MGKKIKWTLLLIIVFLAGVVAGFAGSSFQWHRTVLASFYSTSLTEIAIDAQQLSQEQGDAVLIRKVMALTPLTQSYHKAFFKFMPDNKSRYAPLWQVQKYYEISGDEVPSEIKPILDSMPPRPLTSCELKRLEDAETLTEQESEKD